METDTFELADDLLSGAGEIAAFLGPQWSKRRVHHYVEAGAIPIIRRPGVRTLFARKSEICRVFSAAA